jgi:CHRD domain
LITTKTIRHGRHNKTVVLGIVAASFLMLGIGTAGLTTTIFAQKILYNHFTTKLSGSNEAPPVATAALGIAIFHTLHVGHQQVINYELHLKNIRGVTGAHIHIGNQGENGPVVAGLFNPSMNGAPTGAINGLLSSGTLTSSQLAGPLAGKTIDNLLVIIRSGGAYVNVHTTQNQNGEVRGQIS